MAFYMEQKPVFDKFVISISFMNYLNNKSGMPKVMMEHQKLYNSRGVSYVSLFSIKKNICHDRIMLFCMYGLIIDGKYIGVFHIDQVLNQFKKWNDIGIRVIDIHIHHFMYNRLSNIDLLLSSFPVTPIKIYLHDYYILCSSYNLIKNDKKFCGGKGFNSDECSTCKSKSKNSRVIDIYKILEKYSERINFVSPSENTKKIFCNFYPQFTDQIIVIPHQKCSSRRFLGNISPVDSKQKIKIAYLGMPQANKGWKTWQHVIKTIDTNMYEFYVFNSSDDEYPGIKKIFVQFTKNNLDAMTLALRKNHIDAVLLWSICPETYSYTCFEAFAANSFILTNKDSGNIADVVIANKNGIVFDDESDLIKLLNSPNEFRYSINNYRKNSSGGPYELIENDEIVDISLKGASHGTYLHYENSGILINLPLLWMLNLLYKNR